MPNITVNEFPNTVDANEVATWGLGLVPLPVRTTGKATAVEPSHCTGCGEDRYSMELCGCQRRSQAFADDWYWYVALAGVVALGVASAWM